MLIVDDERLLRQSIKRILEKVGFYVETAMDYESAQKCVKNLQFDLLLVDIVIPKMSGIELVRKLNEEFSLTSTIIFITGEPNLNTSIEAMRVGAIDYLEKPVSRNNLIESIKRSLVSRNRLIEVNKDNKLSPITLDSSILVNTDEVIDPEIIQTLNSSLNDTHNALVKLKKRYGNAFSEDQKTLLNTIVQNNTKMRKMISKLES